MARREVAEYLKNLNLKQVRFGGFDQTEVFESLKKVTEMYEEILVQEKAESDEQLRKLREEMQAASPQPIPAPAPVPQPVVMPETRIEKEFVQGEYAARLKELNEAIEFMGRRRAQIEIEARTEKEKIVAEAKTELDATRKESVLLMAQAEEARRQRADHERKMQELLESISFARDQKAQVYQSIADLKKQLKNLLEET